MKARGAEPVWLTAVQLRILHAEIIRQFGGADGLRDVGLLESAASSPRNRFVHEEDVAVFDLAATLAHSISRNHPFVDGNKRLALQAIRVFLFCNGFAFEPDEVETVVIIEGLAAGEVDVDVLGEWIERSARRQG